MKRFALLLAALLLLVGCSGGSPSEGTALASMSAYPETLELQPGENSAIQVVLTPADAKEQDLLWVSSNSSVATVDDSGKVQGVGAGNCTTTPAPTQGGTETQVVYVRETNPDAVYPAYALTEGEVARMDGETLQFTINQIYAKNGYIFRTDSLQAYFAQMPWYAPVSNDAGSLRMSTLDRNNLNLLVRYRDQLPNRDSISQMGWLWTRYAVDERLSESYVRNLSGADIQLLINTIYAKNGYIFQDSALQALFSGQSWYQGVTRDAASISFNSTDQANLRLLTAHR